MEREKPTQELIQEYNALLDAPVYTPDIQEQIVRIAEKLNRIKQQERSCDSKYIA